MPPNTPTRVATSRSAGHIENGTLSLSIKDNGIGIPAESLSGIFAMFSQVEGAAVHSEGGLGIGLALVNGLTELHGGTVEAKSEGLGHGSEFVVKLPVVTTDAVATPTADAVVPAPIGRRVLVADDNQDAADSLAMILEMAGHDVRVVHDGRSALSVAEAFRPDTVLLDIGMPQLNGYEVAQALRQEPWGASITLIALTGWGQEDDRQRAIDAGFDRHLTKPVDPDALESLIASPPGRKKSNAPRGAGCEAGDHSAQVDCLVVLHGLNRFTDIAPAQWDDIAPHLAQPHDRPFAEDEINRSRIWVSIRIRLKGAQKKWAEKSRRNLES